MARERGEAFGSDTKLRWSKRASYVPCTTSVYTKGQVTPLIRRWRKGDNPFIFPPNGFYSMLWLWIITTPLTSRHQGNAQWSCFYLFIVSYTKYSNHACLFLPSMLPSSKDRAYKSFRLSRGISMIVLVMPRSMLHFHAPCQCLSIKKLLRNAEMNRRLILIQHVTFYNFKSVRSLPPESHETTSK
jgi:hypothetical protein